MFITIGSATKATKSTKAYDQTLIKIENIYPPQKCKNRTRITVSQNIDC